ADAVADLVEAPAGRRVEPGVDALDHDPVGPLGLLDEAVDHLAAVARAEDEPLQPLRGVDLHDVPHDRAAADLHERRGNRLRVLLQPRPPPAAEDHGRRHPLESHGRRDYAAGPPRLATIAAYQARICGTDFGRWRPFRSTTAKPPARGQAMSV